MLNVNRRVKNGGGLCPSGAELQDWAPAGGQVDLVSHDEAMSHATDPESKISVLVQTQLAAIIYHIITLPYCKQWEAGRGPGNEATIKQQWGL